MLQTFISYENECIDLQIHSNEFQIHIIVEKGTWLEKSDDTNLKNMDLINIYI